MYTQLTPTQPSEPITATLCKIASRNGVTSQRQAFTHTVIAHNIKHTVYQGGRFDLTDTGQLVIVGNTNTQPARDLQRLLDTGTPRLHQEIDRMVSAWRTLVGMTSEPQLYSIEDKLRIVRLGKLFGIQFRFERKEIEIV